MTDGETQQYWTISQVKDYFDANWPEQFHPALRTVQQWAKRGFFPNAVKLGRIWRIPEEDVLNFKLEDETEFNVEPESESRLPAQKFEEGNRMILTGLAPLIQDVDDLIAFFNIDLTEWQITRQECNAWTTPGKHERAYLEWENKTLKDGSFVERDGNFRFAQNIQVKATLIRKNPIPIFPVIHPVIAVTKFKRPEIVGLAIYQTLRQRQ